MQIVALEIMKRAAAAGYRIKVGSEGETDYAGEDAQIAWTHVCDLSEAEVVLSKPGAKREWMLVIPDLEPDETAADFSLGGFIEAEWEKIAGTAVP
jgi:hypothetical protein